MLQGVALCLPRRTHSLQRPPAHRTPTAAPLLTTPSSKHQASFDHLPSLQGEALALAGYMPARHNFLPDADWRASWLALVGAGSGGLAGGEFPLVLFALAKFERLAEAARARGAAAGWRAASSP